MPTRVAIEACVGFVGSEEDYDFGPDWVEVEFTRARLLGRGERREDRELIYLQGGLEIAADSRIDLETGAVIDRQCLVKPFEAEAVARLAEVLEGYEAQGVIGVDDATRAAAGYLQERVAAGAAVDRSDVVQGMGGADPAEIGIQTCGDGGLTVTFNAHEEGGVLRWPWTVSLQRVGRFIEPC